MLGASSGSILAPTLTNSGFRCVTQTNQTLLTSSPTRRRLTPPLPIDDASSHTTRTRATSTSRTGRSLARGGRAHVRVSRFTVTADSVTRVISLACWMWASFPARGGGGAGGAPPPMKQPRRDGVDEGASSTPTDFRYGVANLVKPGLERTHAVHSFSSCSAYNHTHGKAANWKNLVLWLHKPMYLAVGDRLSVEWTVDHTGTSSVYLAQLTHTPLAASSESSTQLLDVFDLYCSFVRTSEQAPQGEGGGAGGAAAGSGDLILRGFLAEGA